MQHVFISYVKEDSKQAVKLYKNLSEYGIEVWLDRNDIAPGTRWKKAIKQAILDGAFFLACFSDEYNKRDNTYMNEELTLAIDELRKKPTDKTWFIPVKLSECKIPDREISASETINDIQHLELYKDWDDGIKRIISVIKPKNRMREYPIVEVLSAVIDARDPMTAGHSAMVAKYVNGICEELHLDSDYCEMMRVAALLHDCGKLSVRDSILLKQGPLEPDEYEQIKGHVVKSESILELINFSGSYKQIPEIVGAHHEKINGSGYPRGLKGDEIPLGAQIIAVADFFEAITSKKHYRKPMYLETAFNLIKEKTDIFFKKEIVNALINYCNKSGKDISLDYSTPIKPK